MKRTLIHNATIVNEGQSVRGSVVIENGRIAEVLTHGKPLSAACDETIDATGCCLLPGIIDDHVHFRDPGLTHKADILTESRAAAAGGVTSIMDMPNTNPPTVTLDALNAKLDLLNEKCIVNHSCYFGATNSNYKDFHKLDKHRVCGIKLFMGSSTGNMLVDKINSLQNIFNGTDMLIAAHCEDPAIKRKNDRDALRAAVNSGLIDVIATDHAPHLLADKEGGALKAASGMPMIQFSLVSMLELADEGIFTLETIVEKMCHAPAEIYRIDERGYIREGYRADLVLVRPNAPWKVTADKILSKCGWSPMEGHTFNWKVEKTFANGHLIYSDGTVDESYRGEELRFN